MGNGIRTGDVLRPYDAGDLNFANFEIDPHLLSSVQDEVPVWQDLSHDCRDLESNLLVPFDRSRTGVGRGTIDIQEAGRIDRFRQDCVQSTLIAEKCDGVRVFVGRSCPRRLVSDVRLVVVNGGAKPVQRAA